MQKDFVGIISELYRIWVWDNQTCVTSK